MTAETKLREAASALLVAWVEAHEAGYRAVWPTRFEDLAFLAISETADVAPPPAEEPAPFRRRKNQFPAD